MLLWLAFLYFLNKKFPTDFVQEFVKTLLSQQEGSVVVLPLTLVGKVFYL